MNRDFRCAPAADRRRLQCGGGAYPVEPSGRQELVFTE
jgi:hypothetical protein